jgi:predicted metalloprotease with PDZ domain
MIINNSNGTQNLDDLMKYLYNEYYTKKNIGYTDEEFKAAAEKFCGKNLDEFYSNYIDGTKPIPYREYYESLGLKFTDLNATKEELYFGANASLSNGKLIVSSVMLNSPAYKAGLNVNDEIIAIDNYRVDDVAKYLTLKKINDTINILYARDGKIKSTDLLLEKNTNVKYKLEKPSDQNEQRDKKLKKWLY